ncbi:unnamed protein product [marine sediment metagenome]|uniref:Uncharacterized protein n=1 Tax=marine sediment metagenome TaxID=412755 RepID=X1BAQ2_9ZZZZ
MRLRNGDRRQLIITSKDGTFKFEGGLYVLDDSVAEYDQTAARYAIEYHQDLSIPFKVALNISDIKLAARDDKVSDIDLALNPAVMSNFAKSKVVEGMMKGAGMQEWMQKMQLFIIAILAVTGATLLIIVIKSGMLQSVSGAIPGLG